MYLKFFHMMEECFCLALRAPFFSAAPRLFQMMIEMKERVDFSSWSWFKNTLNLSCFSVMAKPQTRNTPPKWCFRIWEILPENSRMTNLLFPWLNHIKQMIPDDHVRDHTSPKSLRINQMIPFLPKQLVFLREEKVSLVPRSMMWTVWNYLSRRREQRISTRTPVDARKTIVVPRLDGTPWKSFAVQKCVFFAERLRPKTYPPWK